MVLYKLMVVHLSIFTLSTQLMIHCASVYSNSIEYQPFCSKELTSVTSSLHLELIQIGSSNSNNSCTRTLEAPEYHHFLIRLFNPKIGHGPHIINGSCPLYITPQFATTHAWRINPCTMHREELTKILPGNLKIVWEHKGYESPYTITATVLGKGSLCDNAKKFPCLKIGSESLLCISKSLQCDGIRQCPVGSEYENDEDNDYCLLEKGTTQSPTKRISLWNFSNELIRKFFKSTEIFTTESPQKNENQQISFNNTKKINDTNAAAAAGGGSKRIRASLTRGLSRYGPWGYLMLGMLICGTALLICGLWECCCKKSKPQLSAEINAGTTVVTATAPNNSSIITNASVISGAGTVINQQPPGYEDENDLPPSYSVLFPNQKENIQSDSGNPSTVPPIAFI